VRAQERAWETVREREKAPVQATGLVQAQAMVQAREWERAQVMAQAREQAMAQARVKARVQVSARARVQAMVPVPAQAQGPVRARQCVGCCCPLTRHCRHRRRPPARPGTKGTST